MPGLSENIGELFASLLKQDFTAQEWLEMRQRNTKQECTAICHSHDFCDANETMAIAFRRVMGRDMVPDEGEISQEDCDLWNSAWNHAKRNYLTGE